MALSLLGSATCSIPDIVRTDLRTVRLAIACGDRSEGPYTHRKSREAIIYPHGKRERASLVGAFDIGIASRWLVAASGTSVMPEASASRSQDAVSAIALEWRIEQCGLQFLLRFGACLAGESREKS
jgi:hypothetical protein